MHRPTGTEQGPAERLPSRLKLRVLAETVRYFYQYGELPRSSEQISRVLSRYETTNEPLEESQQERCRKLIERLG